MGLERQTSTEGWGPVSTMGLPLPRKSLERLKNQLKKRRRGRLSARRSSVLESGFQPMRRRSWTIPPPTTKSLSLSLLLVERLDPLRATWDLDSKKSNVINILFL